MLEEARAHQGRIYTYRRLVRDSFAGRVIDMQRTMSVLLALLMLAGVAIAQEAGEQANLDRMAAEQNLTQRVEQFVELGMPREAALFVTMLEKSGMEPAQILMFLMMADHGGDEAAGMMMMNQMKPQVTPPQPTVIDTGGGAKTVLIIEDGVLYRIDLDTMEVTGKVAYSAPNQADRDAIWELFIPMMAGEWGGGERGGPGGAPAQQCRNQLKQMGTAFMMYVDDNDGTLPGEDWVDALMPYIENEQLFRCPDHPDIAVGYAMNAKLVGVNIRLIAEPSERILLFDRLDDVEPAIGGPNAVPMGGVHEDGVNVLFCDGHVEWMPVAEAREVLDFPIAE